MAKKFPSKEPFEKKKGSNPNEYLLQLEICNYLNEQYPDIVFISDLSGIRLPIGLISESINDS